MAFLRGRRDESSAPILDSGTSRPLPSPQSCPKGVVFPNAKVCDVLNKAWDQRCDYSDHVTVRDQDILPLHESLLTSRKLGEMSMRDTSSFSKEAEAVTSDVSQMSPHSTTPPISARVFPSWQLRFFIRLDHGGSFHIYPKVAGPFQSIQEAEDAISRHLDDLRSPKMYTDGLSRSEICIRNTLYWPDGTRKKSFNYSPKRRNMVALVHSLLDKYNEDHNLFLGLEYELEDVVSSGEIYESGSSGYMYYHINFTTKRQRANGSYCDGDNLFFAEVTCLKGENEEYVLNSLCAVKPDDKEHPVIVDVPRYRLSLCGNCLQSALMSMLCVDLKHPTDAHKYKGGHSSPYPRCSGFDLPLEILGDFCAYDDEEARLAAEESRIRRIYKCLDDQVFLAKLDGSRIAASAVSCKREDGQGKGARKYGVPAAPADSFKREDGQGKGLRKYVVPAKRLEEYAKLDGGSRTAPADCSKREDCQGKGPRVYVAPARERQLGHVF